MSSKIITNIEAFETAYKVSCRSYEQWQINDTYHLITEIAISQGVKKTPKLHTRGYLVLEFSKTGDFEGMKVISYSEYQTRYAEITKVRLTDAIETINETKE